MTISRVYLSRTSTVVQHTSVDVEGASDAELRRKAIERSADLDLAWETTHTDSVGKASVIEIEALAEGDEAL